jgi:hypothetical protein
MLDETSVTYMVPQCRGMFMVVEYRKDVGFANISVDRSFLNHLFSHVLNAVSKFNLESKLTAETCNGLYY